MIQPLLTVITQCSSQNSLSKLSGPHTHAPSTHVDLIGADVLEYFHSPVHHNAHIQCSVHTGNQVSKVQEVGVKVYRHNNIYHHTPSPPLPYLTWCLLRRLLTDKEHFINIRQWHCTPLQGATNMYSSPTQHTLYMKTSHQIRINRLTTEEERHT